MHALTGRVWNGDGVESTPAPLMSLVSRLPPPYGRGKTQTGAIQHDKYIHTSPIGDDE